MMPKKLTKSLDTAPPKAARARRSATLKAVPPLPDLAGHDPSDEVARRAYELFLESGAEHGHDLEHWLEAERELLAREALAR